MISTDIIYFDMIIKNDKELIEAVKELFVLKNLEKELEGKIELLNAEIQDYLKIIKDLPNEET